MKKIAIYTAAYLALVAIVLALMFTWPWDWPWFEAQQDGGNMVYRGTIVHTAKVEEGYLVYLDCPTESELLYILLVTEESQVEEKLHNWLPYGFTGDKVEAVACQTLEEEPVGGQYVHLVESMILWTE